MSQVWINRTRVAAVIACLMVAACAPANQASQSAGASTSEASTPAASTPEASAPEASAPPPSAETQIKNGGTLVVALQGDIALTDPLLSSDSNSLYVHQNVIEGLVGLKPGSTSEIIPVLAEKLPDVSEDGRVYTFTLRPGVKFHDGTDFDADAVKVNYDRIRDLPESLLVYSYKIGQVFGGSGAASNIDSVEVLGPLQVAIHLKAAQSNFLISQAPGSVFGISSPKALRDGDANNPDITKNRYAHGGPGALVGTGPFMFKEWVPGDHVTIVKNPNYWDTANAAHVDEIVYRPIADPTATTNALESGEIDLAQQIAPEDAATIKADPKLQLIDRGESCNIGLLAFNDSIKPFNNLKIRQAIMYALDRQGYVDAFYAGFATPADNWMPLNFQYAKPLNLPTYDPEKAKALIAESGLSGGDLTLDGWYPSGVVLGAFPDSKAVFEAIARDLEAVGFTVNPHTANWQPDYNNDQIAGKYPMFLTDWTCDWGSVDNFLKTAWFGYIKGEPSVTFHYKNDELNAVMDRALAAKSDEEASALWAQAQDLAGADLPSVPLVNSTAPAAAQSYVRGLVGVGSLTELLKSVWLDK